MEIHNSFMHRQHTAHPPTSRILDTTRSSELQRGCPDNPSEAFGPFSDGFGIMRDAQTAKPQGFRTRDGWIAYDLAVNLAQIRRSRPHGG